MKLNQNYVEKILEYKDDVRSITELAEKTGISRMTVMKYCKLLEINIKVKLRTKSRSNSHEFSEILEGKHPQYPTSKVKRRLILEGYKEDKCEICGNEGVWNGKILSLQLDHIDGNSTNHRLENLRILCPNCHSQTDTFGSKNKRNATEMAICTGL